MKCGPENCPLTAWSALPPSERKVQRQALARKLYEQGFTQQEIAAQFGVSQSTIRDDLQGLVPTTKPHRPRGGRPKGSTRKPPAPPRGADQVNALADQGLSTKEIAAQTGVSERQARRAIEEEQLIRKGREDAEIDKSALSMTAQEKLDAAIRQHKRKIDLEYEGRVLEECKRRLNDISLPQYAKELAELEHSIRSRKGIMDRVTYRKILSCLHPDRVTDSTLKRRYEEAFRLFTELEKRVLDEKESPTEFKKMPRTYEDLMAMKRKVKEARQARKSTGAVVH